ncbi:hypothetical protein RSAG8_12215, partial [Rhizoctonia solani AG-8 WAC10335]
MPRSQLELWYCWLIDGQDGRLRSDQIFRFLQIDRGADSPLHYPEAIVARPEACKLIWGPEEKLYAARVQKMAEDAQLKPNWNDLPLARLQCVYDPFPEKVRAAMSNGCLPEYRTRDIVDLLFDMERFGPVHTRNIGCNETLNAYIHPSMSEEHIMRLLLGPPLHPAALMEDMDEHSNLALPTFIRYVKTTERFRHAASRTWRAGPFGVRWIVATLVHFAAAFSIYERLPQKLPTDRVEAFQACNFSRLKGALVAFGAWLFQTIRDSIAILKETFRGRAEAWRDAVVAAHLNDPDSSIGNESVTLNTHGVPRSRLTLRSCYEALQSQDPDLTLGQDSVQMQRLRRRVNTKVEASLELDEDELTDRDSTSGEEIEFPSDSGEDSDLGSHVKGEEASDISDLELGLFHSRVVSAGTSPGGGPRKWSEQPDRTEMSPAPLDQQVSPDDSQLIEPSWGPTMQEDDADNENDDAELSGRVLSGLSPRKHTPVGTPSKPKSRMVMEVVMNTPSKKSTMKGISHVNDAKGSAKVSHAESEVVVESADDVADDLSKPLP